MLIVPNNSFHTTRFLGNEVKVRVIYVKYIPMYLKNKIKLTSRSKLMHLCHCHSFIIYTVEYSSVSI